MKHKDISRAHALMDSAPWHIEKSNQSYTGKRRSKAKCIHYIKKYGTCKQKMGGCQGSSGCSMYREH